jgi:hypothetical protein
VNWLKGRDAPHRKPYFFLGSNAPHFSNFGPVWEPKSGSVLSQSLTRTPNFTKAFGVGFDIHRSTLLYGIAIKSSDFNYSVLLLPRRPLGRDIGSKTSSILLNATYLALFRIFT